MPETTDDLVSSTSLISNMVMESEVLSHNHVRGSFGENNGKSGLESPLILNLGAHENLVLCDTQI
jgi:hypothetical protein